MRLVFVICLRVSSKKKKPTPKQLFTFLTILLYHLALPVSPVPSVSPSLYHFLTFFLSSGSFPPFVSQAISPCLLSIPFSSFLLFFSRHPTLRSELQFCLLPHLRYTFDLITLLMHGRFSTAFHPL